MIGSFTWDITSAGITRKDATTIVLTMVAGAGGAVALVVTYRKQLRLEEGAFLERLAAAAAQLGDDKAAVQFSGIYALAALADESDGIKHQQCIDVLCGYIRLPYDPDLSGTPGMLSKVEKTSGKPRGIQKETTVTYSYRPAEREVRATIFRIIRDHLRATAPLSWSDCTFDFTGATIDSCDLRGAILNTHVVFAQACFVGTTDFTDIEFSGGTVDFTEAEFTGTVDFTAAEFSGGTVDFTEAEFSGGTVDFTEAEFSGSIVNFNRAEFSDGTVDFTGAEFSGGAVYFTAAKFSGSTVNFLLVEFSGSTVNFTQPQFCGGTVNFNGPRFSGGAVLFPAAEFSGGTVDFTYPEFSGGTLDFSYPGNWSIPPSVPWNDGDTTPAGVRPTEWPPAEWSEEATTKRD